MFEKTQEIVFLFLPKILYNILTGISIHNLAEVVPLVILILPPRTTVYSTQTLVTRHEEPPFKQLVRRVHETPENNRLL